MCDLPERQFEQPPAGASDDLQLCYLAAEGTYADDREACRIGNSPSCQDKLDCEAAAWAKYEQALSFCRTAYGNGSSN
ncbi:MAG: hypothetical protein ACIAQU_04420 [Phycisphaerales bacterium JB064]